MKLHSERERMRAVEMVMVSNIVSVTIRLHASIMVLYTRLTGIAAAS